MSVADSHEWFTTLLRRSFGRVAPLTDSQVDRLWEHWRLYRRWNRVLNLSAIRDPESAVLRHYSESLFLGLALPAEPACVVDVGSGAGFPGFPIAVMRPDCRVVLAESHRRKAVFLQEAVRSVANASVFSGRAEGMGQHFDWLVSRAVAWRQLERIAAGLADKVALLASLEDAAAIAATRNRRREIRWRGPVRLPWDDRGVVLIGECST